MTTPDSPSRDAILTDDTTADVERLQVEAWRRMAPVDKMHLVSQASCAVLDLAVAGIRSRHPDASVHECFLRLAVLKLGPAVAVSIYPDLSGLRDFSQ